MAGFSDRDLPGQEEMNMEEMKHVIEPKYKDKLFRMLFHEKEQLLSLYNALAGRNYTNPD